MDREPTFYDYSQVLFPQRLRERPQERAGQAAFNSLNEIRPDLSERVRTTGLDPFYQDDRLTDFFEFVAKNWA